MSAVAPPKPRSAAPSARHSRESGNPAPFPRYPKYKDSGVEWLGNVPAHWEVTSCRSFVDEQTAKNEGAKDQNYLSLMANVGVLPYEEKGDVGNKKPEDLTKCKMVSRGDFVINSMNYGIGSYGVSSYDGVCSPVYIVLRPRLDRIEPRFAFRLFENRALQTYAQSFGNGILEHRAAITWDILKGIGVAIPPRAEQGAILDFLDCETGKIDALVAEQEKLIALLKEKRQALISHAVTKGLDPNAPMKDSGIEWLGQVPAHWTLGGLTKFIGPVVDYRGRTPTKLDEGIFLVTAKNIRNGAIDYAASEEFVAPDEAAALLTRGAPEIGDVLFTTEAPLGQVAQIDRTDIALAQRIVKFRGVPDVVNNRYLMYWLMGSACQSRLETLATGSTALGIKASKLGMIECLMPPIDEQRAIVNRIEDGLRGLAALRVEAEHAIELLKERRAALISAAVTGKIDVRNV